MKVCAQRMRNLICMGDYVKRQERRADPTWPRRYGDAVRDARNSRALSQQKLADHIGVDQGMISNIELGMVDPTLSTVECIADVLDVTIDTLVGRVRQPSLNDSAPTAYATLADLAHMEDRLLGHIEQLISRGNSQSHDAVPQSQQVGRRRKG